MSVGLGLNISPKALKALAKKKGVPKIENLSAKEFRELQLKNPKKKAPSSMSSKMFKELYPQGIPSASKQNNYSFKYVIFEIDKGYKIILEGKHISKNTYDSLSKREQIRYKNAFKEAADIFKATHPKFLASVTPFSRAEVYYSFYSKAYQHRDHDGNSENIKKFQDTFTKLGLIEDDNRKCLSAPYEPKEFIKEEIYRMEAILLNIAS